MLEKHENLAKLLQEQKLSLLQHELALEKHQESLQQHHLVSDIIQELTEEGVIKDSNNLKLKLTNKELIINGKKQSAELHSKVLKRFQDKPGATVNLEYNINK